MVGTRRGTTVELVRQAGDVLHEVPAFLGVPLIRSRHLRWGSTLEEVAGRMHGDELVPRAGFDATRAISIDARPPSEQR